MDSTHEMCEDELCDFCKGKEGDTPFYCESCNRWACWDCHIVVPCLEEPDTKNWMCIIV